MTIFVETEKLIDMNNRLSLISNIFIFAAGLILILTHSQARIFETIIIIIGILFIVPGCLALVALLSRKAQGKINTLALVPVAGGLLLGIALVAAPAFFVEVLSYTFAVLIIVGAIVKFWTLFSVGRMVKFPVWLYVVPTLMLICGIVILLTDVRTIESVLVLITGISFVAYSANSLLEYISARRYKKSHPSVDVPDVIEIG